jgi:hypothetical protein
MGRGSGHPLQRQPTQNGEAPPMPAMLATLGGTLALLFGLAILLLPLLANELSRPGDSGWGAVILLLGLVLVTSSERLVGAPMLAVLCGGLLIGRLGSEVGQARWRQLEAEERQRLWSSERWRSSLAQLGASLAVLLEGLGGAVAGLRSWIAERRRPRVTTKRWVRPEAPPAAAAGAEPVAEEAPVVSGFAAIDALLAEAVVPDPLEGTATAEATAEGSKDAAGESAGEPSGAAGSDEAG